MANSPPDIQSTYIDEITGDFQIIRNNGTISNIYNVDSEPDLFYQVLDWGEQSTIEIIVV